MIDRKRELLEKIAAEGKATRLLDEELATAKTLEADRVVVLGRVDCGGDAQGAASARRRGEEADARQASAQLEGRGTDDSIRGRPEPDVGGADQGRCNRKRYGEEGNLPTGLTC